MDLRFQYLDGDRFQLQGESEQSVSANGIRLQTNTNTFQTESLVSGVDQGGAHLTTQTLFTSQSKGAHNASQASESLTAEYTVDTLGQYTVAPDAPRPVMRGIPTFAGHDLEDQQTWSAPGSEVVDLSGISIFSQNKRPLPLVTLTFPVSYQYRGTVIQDGKSLQIVELEFTVFYRTPFTKDQYRVFPVLVSGKTHQIVYFNNALGLVDSYAEEDTLSLVLSNGDLYEFAGKSQAALKDMAITERPVPVETKKNPMDVADQPQTKAEDPNQVRQPPLAPTFDSLFGMSPEFVEIPQDDRPNLLTALNPDSVPGSSTGDWLERMKVIRVGTVSFLPNSDKLTAIEKQNLRIIGEVLSKYPDWDILIEGFTTQAGTSNQQRRLSEERSVSVGEFLAEIGAKRPDQIVYRGLGAKRPLAPNDTDENLQKNRRVEITLLQN